MASTEQQANRHHPRSVKARRCPANSVTVIQQRNVRDIFANDEHGGNITRYPLSLAKRTILPVRSVPSSHPTNDASISRMKFAKYWNSKRLQNMGTVVANRMRAPRRIVGSASVNSRIYRASPPTAIQLNPPMGSAINASPTTPITRSIRVVDCSTRHIINQRPDAQAASTMALISNMSITACSHPTSRTVAIALTAMPFAHPRKKSPAKSSLRSIGFRAAPIWLKPATSDSDELAILETHSGPACTAGPGARRILPRNTSRELWGLTNSPCDDALLTSRHQSQLQELEGLRRRSGLWLRENRLLGYCRLGCRPDSGKMSAKSKLLTQRLP